MSFPSAQNKVYVVKFKSPNAEGVAHVDAAAGAVADGWRLDNNELETIDEKLDYLQL